MILVIFSFYAGIGGGMFEVRGNDIVDESFGPGGELFLDVEMVPNLVYSF